MSRIHMIASSEATGATAEVFSKIKKSMGKVPNAYATIGTHNLPALEAILMVDSVVRSGTLSKQDQEAINIAVSGLMGCDYCLAAHTMIGKMVGLSREATKQISAGMPTDDSKRDALVRFVRNLMTMHGTVSNAEYDAITAAGYTESQLIEISLAVSAITFTNAVNRISDTVIDFPAVD